MPRPPKCRFVSAEPRAVLFKPAGIPARELEQTILPLDGFEAIRLVDQEGLEQEEAARRLGVSRPTVTRILRRARRCVADAIVNGRTLLIEGGPVERRTGSCRRRHGGRGGHKLRKRRK